MENMIVLAAESLWPPARVVAAAIGIAMVSLALILFGVGLYTLPKDYRLRFGRRGFRQ